MGNTTGPEAVAAGRITAVHKHRNGFGFKVC